MKEKIWRIKLHSKWAKSLQNASFWYSKCIIYTYVSRHNWYCRMHAGYPIWCFKIWSPRFTHPYVFVIQLDCYIFTIFSELLCTMWPTGAVALLDWVSQVIRRILDPRKLILDHTKWQSKFTREFDLFWTKIRLTSAILDGFSLFKKQNILTNI